MKKFFLAILMMLVTSTGVHAQLSLETVQEQIAQKQALLIDVRTVEEYAQGNLEHSVLLPYEEIGTGISTLTEDKDQALYLYCRSGRRSGVAKDTLERLGFKNVHNIGGYEELKAMGLPDKKL